MSGNLGANLINQLQNTPMASPDYWTHQMANMNALQDYNAKQATADAYRQSVDANGNFDQAGFNARVASGAGAWNAGPTMQAASTLQDTQTRQQLLRVGWYNGAAGALPDDASRDQVIKTIQSGAAVGMSPTEIQAEIGRVPTDPAQLQSYIQQHRLTAASAADQLQRQYGTRPAVNAGATTEYPNVPAPGMPTKPGQTTSVQMTPSIPGQGTTVDIRHSDGTIETVLPDQVDSVLRNKPGSSVVQPGTGGGAANNPLNMRFVGQPGATNSGGFAAFSTPEAGQAATDALFRSYAAGGINTLTGLISKWAPPNENNTPAYIASVAKATGLDPNAPIDLTNPAIATKIQQAMAVVEGNKNARVMPPQGPQGGPQAPPGVQMGQPGDTTPPAPPGGSGAAYAGGGIGAALAPATAQRPDIRTSPTLRGPGAPVPPAPNPIVGAIQAGRQLAAATPMPANALMAGPGAPSSATPAAPWPATTTTVGNYNNPPPAPAAPVVQPPAQAVPPQAQRGAGWSAPPGYAEAQQEAARGSAQDQVAFRRDLPAAQGRIFTAQQALQALEASKTGGGTGWLQAVNNVIGSYEPGFLKNILGPNYDPATLATNRDLAEKYLTQIAMANASRIGPGTDAKLAAAFTGNPNTHIQNLAAQDVLKVQIGLDRMNQAMGDDMQRENISPQEFANWRQTWARTHDPRAFVMDSIAEDPDRLAAFKESMKNASPQEKAIFRSSLVEAQRMGHVQMALPGQ